MFSTWYFCLSLFTSIHTDLSMDNVVVCYSILLQSCLLLLRVSHGSDICYSRWQRQNFSNSDFENVVVMSEHVNSLLRCVEVCWQAEWCRMIMYGRSDSSRCIFINMTTNNKEKSRGTFLRILAADATHYRVYNVNSGLGRSNNMSGTKGFHNPSELTGTSFLTTGFHNPSEHSTLEKETTTFLKHSAPTTNLRNSKSVTKQKLTATPPKSTPLTWSSGISTLEPTSQASKTLKTEPIKKVIPKCKCSLLGGKNKKKQDLVMVRSSGRLRNRPFFVLVYRHLNYDFKKLPLKIKGRTMSITLVRDLCRLCWVVTSYKGYKSAILSACADGRKKIAIKHWDTATLLYILWNAESSYFFLLIEENNELFVKTLSRDGQDETLITMLTIQLKNDEFCHDPVQKRLYFLAKGKKTSVSILYELDYQHDQKLKVVAVQEGYVNAVFSLVPSLKSVVLAEELRDGRKKIVRRLLKNWKKVRRLCYYPGQKSKAQYIGMWRGEVFTLYNEPSGPMNTGQLCHFKKQGESSTFDVPFKGLAAVTVG